MSVSLGALAECELLTSISSSTPAERLAEVAAFKHVNAIAGATLEKQVKRDMPVDPLAELVAQQPPVDRYAEVKQLEQVAKEDPLKLTHAQRLLMSNPLRRTNSIANGKAGGGKRRKYGANKPISYAVDPDIVRGSARQFQMQLYYLLWGECIETDTEGVHPVVSSSKQAQDLFADLNVADVLLYGRTGSVPVPTMTGQTARSGPSTSRLSARPHSSSSGSGLSPTRNGAPEETLMQPVSPLQWFYMLKQNVTNEKKLCRKVDFDHRHVVPEFENRENETPILGSAGAAAQQAAAQQASNGSPGSNTHGGKDKDPKKQAGLVKTCEIICERFRLDPTIEEEEADALQQQQQQQQQHTVGDDHVSRSPSHSPHQSPARSASAHGSAGKLSPSPSRKPSVIARSGSISQVKRRPSMMHHHSQQGEEEKSNDPQTVASMLPSAVIGESDEEELDGGDEVEGLGHSHGRAKRRKSSASLTVPGQSGGRARAGSIAQGQSPSALENFQHRMSVHGRTDPTQTKLDKLYFNKDDLRTFLRNPYGKGALLKFVISKSTQCELIRCTWVDKGPINDMFHQPQTASSRRQGNHAAGTTTNSPFSGRHIKFLVQTRTNSFKLNDNGFSFYERTLTYPHPNDHRIPMHDLENEFNLGGVDGGGENVIGNVQRQAEYIKQRKLDREKEAMKVEKELQRRRRELQEAKGIHNSSDNATAHSPEPFSTATTTALPADDTATLIAQKNNQHYLIRNYEPGSQLYETLRAICDKLAAYFDLVISSAPGPKKRTRKMQLYFRRDACNQLWLLWSDCLEFEDPNSMASPMNATTSSNSFMSPAGFHSSSSTHHSLAPSPFGSPVASPSSRSGSSTTPPAGRIRSATDLIPNHVLTSPEQQHRPLTSGSARPGMGVATMQIREDADEEGEDEDDREEHEEDLEANFSDGDEYEQDFEETQTAVDHDAQDDEVDALNRDHTISSSPSGRRSSASNRAVGGTKKRPPPMHTGGSPSRSPTHGNRTQQIIMIDSVDGAEATSINLGHLDASLEYSSEDSDDSSSATNSGRGSWRAPRKNAGGRKKHSTSAGGKHGASSTTGAQSLAGDAPRAVGEVSPVPSPKPDAALAGGAEEELDAQEVDDDSSNNEPKKHSCAHCRSPTLKYDLYFLQLHTLLHTYDLEASSNGYFHQKKTEWTAQSWQEAPVSLAETKESARRESISRSGSRGSMIMLERRQSLSQSIGGGMDSPSLGATLSRPGSAHSARRPTIAGSSPTSPLASQGGRGPFSPPFSPLGPTALSPDPLSGRSAKRPGGVSSARERENKQQDSDAETVPSFALFLDPTLTLERWQACKKDRSYLDQELALCGKCVGHVWMDPLLVREKFGQSINPIQHPLRNQKSLGAADGTGSTIGPTFAWLKKQQMSPYDKMHTVEFATSGGTGDDTVDGESGRISPLTALRRRRKNFIAHNVALSRAGVHFVSSATRKAQRELSTSEGKDVYLCERALDNRWAHYSDAKEDRDASTSLQSRLIASGALSANIYTQGGLNKTPEDMDRVYGLKFITDEQKGLGGYMSTRVGAQQATPSKNGIPNLPKAATTRMGRKSSKSPTGKGKQLLNPLSIPQSEQGKRLREEQLNLGEGDLAESSPAKPKRRVQKQAASGNGGSDTFLTALGEDDFPSLDLPLELDEIASGAMRPKGDDSGDEVAAEDEPSLNYAHAADLAAAKLAAAVGANKPSKHSFASRMEERVRAKEARRIEREARLKEIAEARAATEQALKAHKRNKSSSLTLPPTVMPGHEPLPGQSTVFDRPLSSPHKKPPNRPDLLMDRELRQQTWMRVMDVLQERHCLQKDQSEKKLEFKSPDHEAQFSLSASSSTSDANEQRRRERAQVYRELRRAGSVTALRAEHGGEAPRSPARMAAAEKERDATDPAKIKKHTLSHSASAGTMAPLVQAYSIHSMPSIDNLSPLQVMRTGKKPLSLGGIGAAPKHVRIDEEVDVTPVKQKRATSPSKISPTNSQVSGTSNKRSTLSPTNSTSTTQSSKTRPLTPATAERFMRIQSVYSITGEKFDAHSGSFLKHSKGDGEVKRRQEKTIVPSTLHVVSMPDSSSSHPRSKQPVGVPPTRAQLLAQATGQVSSPKKVERRQVKLEVKGNPPPVTTQEEAKETSTVDEAALEPEEPINIVDPPRKRSASPSTRKSSAKATSAKKDSKDGGNVTAVAPTTDVPTSVDANKSNDASDEKQPTENEPSVPSNSTSAEPQPVDPQPSLAIAAADTVINTVSSAAAATAVVDTPSASPSSEPPSNADAEAGLLTPDAQLAPPSTTAPAN